MPEATPFTIVAAVAESDKVAMIAAAEQLSACLSHVLGTRSLVRLRTIGRDDEAVPPGALFLASLTADMTTGEPIAHIEQRWRERIARARAAGHERVLLCNLFRHVAPGPHRLDSVERIRRLNLAIVAVSRDTGAEVVDIDRWLALFGARLAKADYRCASETAARLAGHAITAAILDGELDRYLAPEAQQRAIAAHGGVRDIGRLVARQLEGQSAS